MRALLASAWLFACAGVTDEPVDLPSDRGAVIIVKLDRARVVEEVFAFEGARFEPFLSAGANTHHVLVYEHPLSELGMARMGNRLVLADDPAPARSRPLPVPARWIELSKGGREERAPLASQLASALGVVRIPRPPCPTIAVPRAQDRLAIRARGRATFAARLGADDVVLGVAGAPGDRPPPSVVVLRGRTEVPLPTVAATQGAPDGFSLPDGRVWFTYQDAAEPIPARARLCELRPSDPLAPRCAPMAFDDPAPPDIWSPIDIVGQGSGAEVEAVALNWDHVLWHWREGEPWRRVAKGGTYGAGSGRCGVGVETLALAFTGLGSGVVSFPAGPLRRFVVGTASTTPMIEEDPSRSYCRSGYARFPGGEEILVLLDVLAPRMVEPLPRLLWRRPEDPAWRALDFAERFEARFLVPYGDDLILSGIGAQLLPVDFGTTDAEPRVCPAVDVAGDIQQIASLARETFFVAGGDGALVAAWVKQ